MIKALFSRFSIDQRGAMAMLAICAAIPLTLLMFYTVNTSKAMQDKTRAQDAADMIALVHAAEGARSLNTMSMNQVSMTQAWATGSTSGSLITTIYIHDVMLIAAVAATALFMHDECKWYLKIPWVGGALYGVCISPSVMLIGMLLINAYRTNKILWDYDPSDTHEVAYKAAEALNSKNKELINRYPEAVEVAAKQIAQSANVSDIYFDDRCKDGFADSCDQSNKRQGMDLPVVANTLNGSLTFCAALHVGTGGVDIGSLINLPAGMPSIPGLGDMSHTLDADFINGSFVKRKFPMNHGPMRSGNEDYKSLHDYIDATTGIGVHLENYYDFAHDTRLFDGLLNFPATIGQLADFISYAAAGDTVDTGVDSGEFSDLADRRDDASDDLDEGLSGDRPEGMTDQQWADAQNAQGQLDGVGGSEGAVSDLEEGYDLAPDLVFFGESIEDQAIGFNYPWEQETTNNIFTWIQNLKTINICIGDPVGDFTSSLGLDGLSGITDAIFKPMPDIDVYHPKDVDLIPQIMPSIDDFSDAYKPLSMVMRTPNERWAPSVFRDTNRANGDKRQFYTYSQTLLFNPDEIGLYSQNWQSRLIPATKMGSGLAGVLSRMEGEIPEGFNAMKENLGAVQDMTSWGQIVAK